MNKSSKKVIKEIQRREQTKQEALEKGWRSRLTLLFKVWLGADYAMHLEWLGYYDKADEVRAKYKMGLKEYTELTTDAALAGIDLITGRGAGTAINSSPISRLISSMIYTVTEFIKVLFGAYKQDAFGLPVCWTDPQKAASKKPSASKLKSEPIVVNTLSDDIPKD